MSEPANITKTTGNTTSPSPTADPGSTGGWPALPTETDIYILPDGRVVIADLPAGLAGLAALGAAEPCEIARHGEPDPPL